ncbi:MAG: condensation domain-containing protein, partial [Blastocatellia bacterium]
AQDSTGGAQSPIGSALDDLSIYLSDDHGKLAPIGAIAEIMVGGDGLSRGYLSRPDLTAARFIPDLFSGVSGSRLYRSGDLGHYTETADINYIGRSDDQLKIRGFRIEPGEIEAALKSHPAISQSAVTVRSNVASGNGLAAYLVCAQGEPAPSIGDVRSFLADRIPEYMIPAGFVFLDALPLTANGKLDRRALPAPAAQILQLAFEEPRTSSEKMLAKIWEEALGVERVGINDNYFELGGDSIISIQIVSKARESGLQITPKDIFEHPTVSRLAQAAGSVLALEPYSTGDAVPLTPIQHWFFEQMLAEQHYYNQAVMLDCRDGALSVLLEDIFHRLVDRHEALRFRYELKEDGWIQHPAERQDPGFVHRVDLSALSDSEQEQEIAKSAGSAQASLSLSEGPMARVVYSDLGQRKAAPLLVVIHHLAVDGVSWRILLEDIEKMWSQLIAGEPMCLPAATPFSRWSKMLSRFASKYRSKSEIDYWSTDVNETFGRLPLDRAGGPNIEGARRSVSISLTTDQTRHLLRDLPAAYGTRINEVLLTALAVSLSKWMDDGRMLIDLEGHGREDILAGTGAAASVDTSKTVGWFTTIFPVVIEVSQPCTPTEALRSVKEQLRRIPDNGIGYGILKYHSGDSSIASSVNGAQSLLPQAEISFNYLGQLDTV